MKKILLLFVAISFFTFSAHAQKDETIFGKTGIHLTGAWGGYMHNISSFQDDFSISRNGFFVFELNKKVLIGWDGLNAQFALDGNSNVNLNSNGLTVGYSPWAHKPFHPVFNMYAGRGNINNEDIIDNIQVYQPSVTLELNVFRWMKIGLDGGYRIIQESNLNGFTDQELSGPYAGLKLKFGWSWD
jgi:hypothetical protein